MYLIFLSIAQVDGRLLPSVTLWNRVVATPSPGMTAEESFECEPTAFECAIFAECFDGILRAGGCKSASRVGFQRRDADLIEADKRHEWGTGYAPKFCP